MELKTSVAIVSTFGRGNWLAVELARKGIPTALIDVTESSGNWAPEDWEGPFGYFRTDKLSPSQSERLVSDEATQELPQGFTFWLQSGPLELKGPVTQHRMNSVGISPNVSDYIAGYDNLSNQSRLLEKEKIQNLPFENSWLAHFASLWSSSTYALNPQGVQTNKPSPMMNSFFVREATRQGLDKSLQWVQKNNVQVFEKVKILDISFGDRKAVTGIEIKSEHSGLLRADYFIWMLTSEETRFLNEKLVGYFYPKAAVESEWSWVRYRAKLKACPERDHLPLQLAMIQNLDLHWCHENFCILKRNTTAEDFDAWIKIPTVQRFNRQYLREKADKLVDFFNKRIPAAQMQVSDYPQEFHYSYQQLGPSRNPIYKKTSKLLRTQFENLIYDGPEDWDHLGWNGSFEAHQAIAQTTMQWWAQLQIKLAKKKQREEQREAKK